MTEKEFFCFIGGLICAEDKRPSSNSWSVVKEFYFQIKREQCEREKQTFKLDEQTLSIIDHIIGTRRAYDPKKDPLSSQYVYKDPLQGCTPPGMGILGDDDDARN